MNEVEFQQFFEGFFPSLCIFAQKYVRDMDVATDIAQDAFITLWDGKDGFSNEGAAKGFLYTVARNNCLNLLKKKQIREDYHRLNVDTDAFFNDHVIEEETYRILYRVVAQLPPQSRKIIELSLQGMKNPEIATRLDISLNSVKTLKIRAYRSLRLKLEEHVVLLLLLTYLLFC